MANPTRTWTRRVLALGAAGMLLALAACAPAAPAPATSGPAKEPAPKPTEVSKPATQPTEASKPAAKPTEASKPAAKPTEASKPAAQPASEKEAARSPALQALVDGARKEGSLSLVWSASTMAGPAGVKKMQDMINKKYDLNLTFNFTPGPAGPATGAKVVQEVAAGQPSHTDIHIFIDASNNKAFQPVDWQQYVPGLPAEAMQYEKRAVGILSQIPGITYNNKLVPADKVPSSMKDLLDPWWKGKIGAPPYAYTIQFLTLPEFMGYDAGMDFMKKFSAQLGGLIRCGEEQRVASGEFLALAMDCGDYRVRQRQREGLPLGHVIPVEGGAMKFYSPAVPITSPHPNAAKLWVAFMLSREGQDFLWEAEGGDNHRIPGSKTADVLKNLVARGAKFLDAAELEQKHPEVAKNEEQIVAIFAQGAKP